jgi:hypothetical protein
MESVVDYAIQCGQLLIEQKARLKHGEWKPWVEANCEFSFRAAQKYMQVSSQKRTAMRFSSLQQALGYDNRKGNHLAQGTGENEWYTPADYVQLANRVMGDIDLDPASSIEANETVKAEKIYTAEDDGLIQPWHGRIWLNPPYSRDLMPAFVDKLIAEYSAGHVSEAILVSHNNTETKWFQSLAQVCTAVCFPAKRVKFYRGDDVAAPVNGQVFFYLGNRSDLFATEFGYLGVVMVPTHVP